LELAQIVKILFRWSWVVVLAAIIGGAVVYRLSMQQRPVYEATTTLIVHQTLLGSPSSSANTLSTSDNPPQTVAELLQARPVIDEVIANLKLNVDYDTFTTTQLSITLIRGTPLVQVSVRDTNPQRAADLANEIPAVFTQQRRDEGAQTYSATKQYLEQEVAKAQLAVTRTETNLSTLKSSDTSPERDRLQVLLSQQQTNYQSLIQNLAAVGLQETQMTDIISVTDPAVPPQIPAAPRPLLYSALAAIICAMLAAGGVLTREMVNDTIESSGEFERLLGAPPLGLIARIRGSKPTDKLVTVNDTHSPIAEAYRVLAAKIEFSEVNHPTRTIVVTSSVPMEGKSTTAANVAVALAQSGKRVILVDTDLRLPRLHEFFPTDNNRGLTSALGVNREDSITDHLIPTGVENLSFMPSGPVPGNPSGLLGSSRFLKLIDELKSQSDVIIFDSPPVLGVVDATLLAHACDATLLVARGGLTRARSFSRARDQLLGSGANLIGTVLNRVSPPSDSHHAYHRYYRRQRQHQQVA
jgi:capsular exopolysaccharide synthesis family protein